MGFHQHGFGIGQMSRPKQFGFNLMQPTRQRSVFLVGFTRRAMSLASVSKGCRLPAGAVHLLIDSTGMIMASTLTENEVGDPSQVAPLLDQVDAEIGSVTADGAYDGMPTYDAVAIHGENIAAVIPPPVTSVLSDDAALNPWQRDRHIAMI